MSSFQSFLHVSGKKYEILYSDLDIHQKIDSLGRPASATFGGMFNVAINMPDSGDSTLFEWMFDPAKILNCKVVLNRIDSHAVLKTIKFYNAYCVGMDVHFDGTANASSFRLRLRISPEQFDINGLFHDNRWPDESPIQQMADEDGPSEPGLLSDIAHGVLDVVGLVPVVGELADGANALFYLAEGNKTDAALSAAAMIPIAGWAATGAKAVRKGVKIANKAKALKGVKLAKQLANPSLKTILPAWKKVSIDIEHIASGHMAGGKRTSALKDLFPAGMTKAQVEKTVQSAYKNVSDKISTQGDRILVRGTSDNGLRIEMWVNKVTKVIETAYPVSH